MKSWKIGVSHVAPPTQGDGLLHYLIVSGKRRYEHENVTRVRIRFGLRETGRRGTLSWIVEHETQEDVSVKRQKDCS